MGKRTLMFSTKTPVLGPAVLARICWMRLVVGRCSIVLRMLYAAEPATPCR